MTTKRRLTRVAPLKAGIVLGIIYGIAGLIVSPFMFSGLKGASAAWVVLFPILYAIGGFVGGIIAAALYNLVAKWTGGLEFEVSDDNTTV